MDLLNILMTIPDRRHAEGREYRLEHILYFSVIALLSNAKGFSDITRFIEEHFDTLKSLFKLKWRRCPTVSAIQKIIVGVDPVAFAKTFEEAASKSKGFSKVDEEQPLTQRKQVCFDGKTLRGSFSHTKDKRAQQVFQVFATHSQLILAHLPLEDKDSEIPALQEFLGRLNLKGCIVTADALHCQKKHLSAPERLELSL